MVGFKTLFLVLTLLILGACVPQVKQTECGRNEAFSSTLRICVPITNGPESYINIQNPSPLSAITLSRLNTSNQILEFTVHDPYSQGFNITWERSFNGSVVNLPTTINQVVFQPSALASISGLGTYLFTAKIWSGGNVVKTHSFQVIIVDAPKPTIRTGSSYPMYHTQINPTDPHQQFGFTVENGQAVMSGGINYRIDWKVYKNGSYLSSADSTYLLPNTGIGQQNPVAYSFDHNAVGTGVGNYQIIGFLTNNASEMVAQQQWSLTISHPPRTKIISQTIYNPSLGLPQPGGDAQTTAYHGINYNLDPAYNFVPSVGGYTNQAQYCVNFAAAQGTYTGTFIKVDFYLDSTHFWSTNTAADPYVCLSSAGATVLSGLLFNNASANIEQVRTISARVTDLYTNEIYTTDDLQPPMTHLPSWPVLVRPVNPAPIVRFTDNTNLSGITCPNTSTDLTTISKTCSVTQDAPFVVGINAIDEFYDTSSTTDAQQNKFSYQMTLLRNGSPVSSCIKNFTDVADTNTPGTDFVGPDYLCEFTVASFDALGSVNPATNSYAVQIQFRDSGSPISGSSPAAGQTITYALNVKETNTAPTIVAQGLTLADSFLSNSLAPLQPLALASDDSGIIHTYITEGEVLNFNLKIRDNERDDFTVTVQRCSDASCATPIGAASVVSHNKMDSALETSIVINMPLAEDFVPGNTAANTNVDAFFKISVIDNPDTDNPSAPLTLPQAMSSSTVDAGSPLHFSVNVRNKNPSPQFAGTPVPSLTAPNSVAVVGYPFQISPGTVTDDSVVGVEKVIRYKWYVDPTGGDDSYVAIPGAESDVLHWTPSNDIADGTVVNIAVCVSNDQPINPQPAVANIGALIAATNTTQVGANCLGSWNVTVRNNTVALSRDGSMGGDISNSPAVWQDTTITGKRTIYTAYSDASHVYVEKTTFDASGVKHSTETDGFRTVSFPAASSGTIVSNSIKDLSLAGTSTHLYVAYRAADFTTNTSYIRVRRIDKRDGTVSTLTSNKADPTFHDTKTFGFRYDPTIPTSTAPASVVSIGLALTYPYTVTFLNELAPADTLVVHGVDLGPELCRGLGIGCTNNGNATALAAAINNSTSRNLQGVSAKANANVVEIYGDVGHEYSEGNPFFSGGKSTSKLGKIFISAGVWYLPYLKDAAPNPGTISTIYAASGETDRLATVAINEFQYTSLNQLSNFENDFDGTHVIFAEVGTDNQVSLNKFIPGVIAPVANQDDIFFPLNGLIGIYHDSIRLAGPNSGNTNVYVAAKALNGEWLFGQYNSSLVTSNQGIIDFMVSPTSSLSPLTLHSSNIQDLQIQAMASATVTGLTEARLVVKSNQGSLISNLYAVRYFGGKLSCDICEPINTFPIGSQGFSISRVDTQMSLGAIGGIPAATPITKEVIFLSYGMDTDLNGIHEPQMSIINANAESIQAISVGTGFRPPYFGGN